MPVDRLVAIARRVARGVRILQEYSPLLLALSGAPLIGWLVAARGLRGRQLARWLAMPVLLFGAAICLLGPGHLFPKEPFEGPTLLRVSQSHAIVALDLIGLIAGGLGILLGAWAVWERLSRR